MPRWPQEFRGFARQIAVSHARLLHVERAIYKVDSLHSTRSARLPWHTQDRRCEAVVAETVASIRNLHEQCGLGRADWQCGPRSVVLVIPFFGTKSTLRVTVTLSFLQS